MRNLQNVNGKTVQPLCSDIVPKNLMGCAIKEKPKIPSVDDSEIKVNGFPSWEARTEQIYGTLLSRSRRQRSSCRRNGETTAFMSISRRRIEEEAASRCFLCEEPANEQVEEYNGYILT